MAIKLGEYVKIEKPESMIKEGDIVRVIHSFDYPLMKDNEISRDFHLPPRHVDRIGELALVTRINKRCSGYELCFLKDSGLNAWWSFESVEYVRPAKVEEVVTLKNIVKEKSEYQRTDIHEIAKWDLLEERAKNNFLNKTIDYISIQIDDLKRSKCVFSDAYEKSKKLDNDLTLHAALIRIKDLMDNDAMTDEQKVGMAFGIAKTALERDKMHRKQDA